MKKILTLLLFFAAGFWIFSSLPDVSFLKTNNPQTTAFMKLYHGPAPLQYDWVSYSSISPYLKQAIVIAEDANFFGHAGIDWRALWEAMRKNWEEKEWIWGGSTLTQQLAKNLFLSPSKNPVRKIKEAMLAWKLESTLSKQRILELYLNIVEWGEGIYGAEAASRHYFNISAASLDPMQAAQLAVILPSPRNYGKNIRAPFVEKRMAIVLKRMGY